MHICAEYFKEVLFKGTFVFVSFNLPFLTLGTLTLVLLLQLLQMYPVFFSPTQEALKLAFLYAELDLDPPRPPRKRRR